MPRISIITGIYNCADTLSEALDSILAQTYSDWKMILCDDGSIDNTFEVAKRYADRYPEKFILLKNDMNMGLNFTLNHCLSVANSEYIARMDGDDISLPERFQKEVDFLDTHHQYAFVSTPMMYFDERGVFRVGKGLGEPDPASFVRGAPFSHATVMVRREAYEAVGRYTVDDRLLRVEDQHLWIKLYAAGYKGFVLDEPLYMMRDDRDAYKRRKFRYRINESRVVGIAVKELKLPLWKNIYILRPILIGLLPNRIYCYLHKRG